MWNSSKTARKNEAAANERWQEAVETRAAAVARQQQHHQQQQHAQVCEPAAAATTAQKECTVATTEDDTAAIQVETGGEEVKHDLRKLCQSLIRTEIDVEVV